MNKLNSDLDKETIQFKELDSDVLVKLLEGYITIQQLRELSVINDNINPRVMQG